MAEESGREMDERSVRAGGAAALYGALVGVGALVGILALSALRFAAMPTEGVVHYHANWAIFVDGERLDLTAARYMEDVFQCTADPLHVSPESRVHMHEGNHDVVHVHDGGVTWGHLLANLDFGIGDDHLYTQVDQYTSSEGRSLKFILNGSEVRSIRNRVIENEDRLLISYGVEPVEGVIASQYPQVAATAGEYNHRPDPASCAGPQEAHLSDRIRRAVWY